MKKCDHCHSKAISKKYFGIADIYQCDICFEMYNVDFISSMQRIYRRTAAYLSNLIAL